jgi:two-component system chemotaxis response regulator CheB
LRIKQRGGLTIVQDPQDAEAGYMPEAAIEAVHPDHILTAEGICEYLIKLNNHRAE